MTQSSSNRLPSLTAGEVKEMCEASSYSEKQVKEWYRGFVSQCPGGELDKEKLFDMYCLLLPPGIARIFVEQLFTLFDGDKSGSIDFKEFLIASNMPTSGSAREKLLWIFEMYDEDRSGAIGMSEMLEILSTLHEMEGAPTDNIQTIALSMFSKMEVQEDQELTKDQFISVCLMDESLLELLRGEEEKSESDNK